MSKYTEKQLSDMAEEVMQAKRNNDPRYEMMLITMCVSTGLDPRQVERNIESLIKR